MWCLPAEDADVDKKADIYCYFIYYSDVDREKNLLFRIRKTHFFIIIREIFIEKNEISER